MAAGTQTAVTPFAQNMAFVAAAGVVALAGYPVHTLACVQISVCSCCLQPKAPSPCGWLQLTMLLWDCW
jgi:hypothetical protein